MCFIGGIMKTKRNILILAFVIAFTLVGLYIYKIFFKQKVNNDSSQVYIGGADGPTSIFIASPEIQEGVIEVQGDEFYIFDENKNKNLALESSTLMIPALSHVLLYDI